MAEILRTVGHKLTAILEWKLGILFCRQAGDLSLVIPSLGGGVGEISCGTGWLSCFAVVQLHSIPVIICDYPLIQAYL